MIVVRAPPGELAATPIRVVSDVMPPNEMAATYGDPPALIVDIVAPETDFGGIPLIISSADLRFMLIQPSGAYVSTPFPDVLADLSDLAAASLLDAVVAKVDADIAAAIAALNADIAATNAQIEALIAEARADIASLQTSASEAFAELAANATTILSVQSDLASAHASLSEQIAAFTTTSEALSGEITTIHAHLANTDASITTEAVARATATEALAATLTTLTATVAGNTAAISAEAIARANADSALAATITTLTATVAGNTAAISTEVSVRAAADSVLAANITTLTTNLGTTNANLTSEITTRASADSALSAAITSETASRVSDIGTVTASVTTEVAARVAGDTALAASISTLTTTVSGHTATITTIIASLNGVEAQWAVQATLNGVSGHLEFDGLQRADGTGAVFVFDILADVNIHGSLVVNGTIINGKLANESATVIRSATSPSTISIPGGFPFSTTTTIFTWTFNSPVAGNTQVDYSAVFNVGGGTSLGVGSSVTQINVYLDGTLQEIDQMTTGLNTRTFSFASLAAGNHTVRVDCSILGDGSTVSNQILRSFIGSK